MSDENIARPPGSLHAPISGTRTFKEFPLWQKAHEFTLATYEFTRRFPGDERNGLATQFRTSSTEISAKMAEVFATVNPTTKMKLLDQVSMELGRCVYYMTLCQDLKFGENPQLSILADEIYGLIHDHRKSIRNSLSLPL